MPAARGFDNLYTALFDARCADPVATGKDGEL
jgi:hypothetical protein